MTDYTKLAKEWSDKRYYPFKRYSVDDVKAVIADFATFLNERASREECCEKCEHPVGDFGEGRACSDDLCPCHVKELEKKLE